MRKFAFIFYMFMAFMSLEYELSLSDDCPNCFAISQFNGGNNYNYYQQQQQQQSPYYPQTNRDQRQYESAINLQYLHPPQNNYGHLHHQQQHQHNHQPQIHSSLLKPAPQPQQPPSLSPPKYRPIIMAYHPRVNNRHMPFFTRNSDHLLDDNPTNSNEESDSIIMDDNDQTNTDDTEQHQNQQQQQQQQQQLHQQLQSFVRIPQKSVRQKISSDHQYWPPLINHTFGNIPENFATTTTTTLPPPPIYSLDDYEEEFQNHDMMYTATSSSLSPSPSPSSTTTTTVKPNYRPRPVSVRLPTTSPRPSLLAKNNAEQQFSSSSSSSDHQTNSNNRILSQVENPIDSNNIENINLENNNNGGSGRYGAGQFKPRRNGPGRQRRRQRTTTTSSTTTTSTTTTTTTEQPYYDYGDYYDYDQDDYDDDDYDYLATTTTTTTTTRRPRDRHNHHRGRGHRRRGGGRRRYHHHHHHHRDDDIELLPHRKQQEPLKPTEPSTTTTTTTLSPNYKPRPDGRIIDYNADPNFPYELKGADLTDYPFYISIPETDFNCKGRHDGYYANIDLKCQVYHHCAIGHQRYDFLCPNYTLFDQTTFTCRFINTVDCDASENHYKRNNDLYVQSTTNGPNNLYGSYNHPPPQSSSSSTPPPVKPPASSSSSSNNHDHLQTSGSDSSSSQSPNNNNDDDDNYRPNQLPLLRLNKRPQQHIN
ncbi:hypothetical protein DERP_010650 [Dermatophagoides pteronyssinus]|uniref:Uncharacterized protein n=2 Tax=Dermatophagoides pteronyssinus TaxID=6956 RepID=A0ABQ8JA02_DERPT|nr:probable serine/threonine-protein kinase DDB_G0282963 [Dermatophagoides pteronyssinus]KAH9419438.1 hypothetical protein DERP_010650 [Dermatophagoides pteronyssinus]